MVDRLSMLPMGTVATYTLPPCGSCGKNEGKEFTAAIVEFNTRPVPFYRMDNGHAVVPGWIKSWQ